MQAGKLRHRVTLQRYEETRDDMGAVIETWVDVATVWAAVEPLSVREFISAQAGQSEISARITIRYRPGIDATMRVLHRDQIYNIKGPPLPDPRSGREYLTLAVAAGVNDG